MKQFGKSNLLLIILLFYSCSTPRKRIYTVPGDITEVHKNFKESKKSEVIHLPNVKEHKSHMKDKLSSEFLADQDDINKKGNKIINDSRPQLGNFAYSAMGKLGKSDNYIEYDYKKDRRAIYNTGDYSLNFYYTRDNYDVSDINFTNIFINGDGSSRVGTIHLGVDKYIFRSYVNMSLGINTGIGFNRGRTVFVNSREISDVYINLWTIPVDFSAKLELPLHDFFKLSISGGPSIMILYQGRSDLDDSNKKKNIIQSSYGTFALGELKTNISRVFKSTGKDVMYDYNVTNFYLNLGVRYQQFENFNDDLSIKGHSYIIGFSFEYI